AIHRPRFGHARITLPVTPHAAIALAAPRTIAARPNADVTASVSVIGSFVSRGSNHRKIGNATPNAQTIPAAAGRMRRLKSAAARAAGERRVSRRAQRGAAAPAISDANDTTILNPAHAIPTASRAYALDRPRSAGD